MVCTDARKSASCAARSGFTFPEAGPSVPTRPVPAAGIVRIQKWFDAQFPPGIGAGDRVVDSVELALVAIPATGRGGARMYAVLCPGGLQARQPRKVARTSQHGVAVSDENGRIHPQLTGAASWRS